MDNYSFLKIFFRILDQLMLQKTLDLGYATLSFSEYDSSVFWNLALTNQLLNKQQICQVEDGFNKAKRIPAIYFEENDDNSQLKEILLQHNYKKAFEDSWMFYQNSIVDKQGFELVKKVKNKKDFEIFLNIFNRCYQKDDPQNPYGELGEYIGTMRRAWNKNSEDSGIECFVVYENNTPVAVSTLNNCEDVGYISNVGSLREVRGKGFGKLATLYAVSESLNKQHKITCLGTEEGTYPNKFYKRLGFQTKFTATAFSK